MSRYLLERRGGSPPAEDLTAIRGFAGLTVVEERPPRALIVDVPDELVPALKKAIPGWFVVGGYSAPLPSTRPTTPRNEAAALEDRALRSQLGGDLQEAARLYHQALERFRLSHDDSSVAWCLHNLAVVELQMGAFEKGASREAEALALFRRMGVLSGQSVALFNLVRIAEEAGHLEDAIDKLEQLRSLHREAREEGVEAPRRAAQADAALLSQIAHLQFRRGDLASARSALDTAIAIHRELADRANEGIALNNLAAVAWMEDRLGEARQIYCDALEIHRAMGSRSSERLALDGLARVSFMLGGLDEAKERAKEALILHAKDPDYFQQSVLLVTLGVLSYCRGQVDDAIRYHEEARSALQAVPPHHPERNAVSDLISSNLGAILAIRVFNDATARALREGALKITSRPSAMGPAPWMQDPRVGDGAPQSASGVLAGSGARSRT